MEQGIISSWELPWPSKFSLSDRKAALATTCYDLPSQLQGIPSTPPLQRPRVH